ncbi:hypothetical protein ACFL6I_09000 [candidate division KSB1 bacterium]
MEVVRFEYDREERLKAPVHPYLAILIAVVFISSASILVRFSTAPAAILSFYRVFLAAVFLAALKPVKVFRGISRLESRHLFISA